MVAPRNVMAALRNPAVSAVMAALRNVMAALRNAVVSALRLSGRTDITEATRWATRQMDRPFTILGLSA
jgi:hypothetical protein